ncbi:taurine ABC transporter substrate-binding protein [Acinetobacter wuhouensis]|uniref:Taurine ABC transporter substrate-binding protein n=1 Tax=Acinetobacter wuhouensis TaxID=1879050 RepID=A0A3G2T751_9GAMM|nr:taurine ABC transporter substrate-binding protein [Acinetobacter wuhouensis]AYO56164.1 taurine ABC transporter substrate-binding protein [Acinetobacter wuhouensis]RZG44073.1 taurine ABC transporter substrate-binding protein [Acinetobacter wuhouensis]
MKLQQLILLSSFTVLLGMSGLTNARPIVIGYQTNIEPAKVAQADGVYDKAIGQKLDWRLFNSGAEVLTALASGSVDIALIGSSPLGAAVANNLPIEVFLISTDLKSAEALVVRNGSGIHSPKDLIGKKIATPFASTAHYSLLGALKHWNIKTNQIRLLNLKPAEINAAWRRGDIDAAFVWSPALANIQKTGKVMTDAGQVGQWGSPTFEVWVARKDFAKKHPEVLSKFSTVTLNYYDSYNRNKKQWTAHSPAVQKIAKITGVDAQDVPTLLAGAEYPNRQVQLSQQYLGGRTIQNIANSVNFLKAQGLVKKVSPDYQQFITTRYISGSK